MEVDTNTVLITISVLCFVGSIFLTVKSKLKKGTDKQISSATKDAFKEFQEYATNLIASQKKEIKSLRGALYKYRGLEGEEEEEEQSGQDPQEALIMQAVAKKFNIPAQFLESDEIKRGLRSIMRDKNVKAILPYLIKGQTGNNPLESASEAPNPNYL